MYNILTFIAILYAPFFSSAAIAQEWTGLSGCGIYQVDGVGRSTKEGLVLVVNEKTKSEFTINVPIKNELFLAPYVDKTMHASVEISKKSLGSKIEGTIKEIKRRIQNPLDPMDTGVKLISKAACK